jgi:alkylation response protein AidB-like acyl-CoA dehydrogenase
VTVDSTIKSILPGSGTLDSVGMSVLQGIDDRWPLSERERHLIELVKGIVVDRIQPNAEKYDQSAEFPSDNLNALARIGCNRLFIPEAYGGTSASYLCLLRVVEEISRGCPSTAISWATTYHAVSPLIRFGTHDQKQRYLPQVAAGAVAALAITESGGGSDVGAGRTTMRPEGHEVVITGGKLFITNGDVADLIVVFGKWAEVTSGSPLTAVIVDRDTPGLVVGKRESKLGHRASSTVELSFDNLRVPDANIISGPGEGHRLLLSTLNKSRPTIAAQALGIARAALDSAVRYTNERNQSDKRILELQGIQFKIADLAARLVMCRTMLSHVGGLVEEGAAEDGIEASMLKVAATDLAVESATTAVQLMGGEGYLSGCGAERLFRDAKVTQIWEGANELHRGRIGRSFLARKAPVAG